MFNCSSSFLLLWAMGDCLLGKRMNLAQTIMGLLAAQKWVSSLQLERESSKSSRKKQSSVQAEFNNDHDGEEDNWRAGMHSPFTLGLRKLGHENWDTAIWNSTWTATSKKMRPRNKWLSVIVRGWQTLQVPWTYILI